MTSIHVRGEGGALLHFVFLTKTSAFNSVYVLKNDVAWQKVNAFVVVYSRQMDNPTSQSVRSSEFCQHGHETKR